MRDVRILIFLSPRQCADFDQRSASIRVRTQKTYRSKLGISTYKVVHYV